MIYYLIPARKGSQRFPGKNRMLFRYTADLVQTFGRVVVVSTDDEEIFKAAHERGFSAIHRPDEFAADDADMICVMNHAIEAVGMNGDDIIILLYLTSPMRTKEDIMRALILFRSAEASSVVCRAPAAVNPHICIYADGTPVIRHDFYRTQDFPVCYKVHHHVAVYRVSEIGMLNKLLFNERTMWLDMPQPMDIDFEKEFLSFKENTGGQI